MGQIFYFSGQHWLRQILEAIFERMRETVKLNSQPQPLPKSEPGFIRAHGACIGLLLDHLRCRRWTHSWASAASSACHGAFSARKWPISAIIFGAVVLQDQVSRSRAIRGAFRQYS